MQTLNRKVKSATALVLCTSLLTQSLAFAGNGGRGGNGGDDPTIAYSNSQAQQIQAHMNLDYLKLTPNEIRKRDKKLKPIYDYYQQATLQKVLEQIENTFGSNIYVYNDTAGASLKDKAGTMDSAVTYYTEGYSGNSAFVHIDPSIIGPRETVSADGPNHLVRTTSDSYLDATSNVRSAFALEIRGACEVHRMWISDRNHQAVYSNLGNHLFEMPVMDRFISAMKDLNLKGLDATIVFTAGSSITRGAGGASSSTRYTGCDTYRGYDAPPPPPAPPAPEYQWVPEQDGKGNVVYDENGQQVMVRIEAPAPAPAVTKVVYPMFSHLAPIPQPIVYISKDASESDIAQMLQENAPKIYAYNQLFNKELLPQAEQIADALAKYPAIGAALAKANKTVSAANQRDALYHAFLSVSFGLMAAGMGAVSIYAMLNSPILMPLIIEQTTVVVF